MPSILIIIVEALALKSPLSKLSTNTTQNFDLILRIISTKGKHRLLTNVFYDYTN